MADMEDENLDSAEDDDLDIFVDENVELTRERELLSDLRNVAGERELQSDLRSVVNKEESSDIAFICSDGIRVYACRWLLANRCTVFKSMLSNGMLETTLPEIQMEKFSSSVMLAIIEYLYTGTILSCHDFNWKMGFEIISAAQFFMIPQVESMTQKVLCFHASRFHRMEKAVLMDMLNVAVGYPEVWEGKAATLQKLTGYIGHDWFEEDCSPNLSRSAVEYILSASKHNAHQGESEPSMEEYFTFRKIVLWHAYQVVPASNREARTAINDFLPGNALTLRNKVLMTPTDIDDYVSDTSFFMDPGDSPMGLNFLVGTNTCKDSLQQLLQHINLSRIPASLLLKVIHPLRIFPPRQLLKAIFHLAHHRRAQYAVSGFDWKHGPSLRVCGDGQIFCGTKDGYGKGMAIAFIPLPKSSGTGIYEWSFEIIENSAQEIQLGFFCQAAGHAFEEDEMLEEDLQSSSSTRVLCSDTRAGATRLSKREPKPNIADWIVLRSSKLELNSVVDFKLNVSERSCQVRFRDYYEAVWEDLPDGEYYPAVSFLDCYCAKVELKLVSGFDSY